MKKTKKSWKIWMIVASIAVFLVTCWIVVYAASVNFTNKYWSQNGYLKDHELSLAEWNTLMEDLDWLSCNCPGPNVTTTYYAPDNTHEMTSAFYPNIWVIWAIYSYDWTSKGTIYPYYESNWANLGWVAPCVTDEWDMSQVPEIQGSLHWWDTCVVMGTCKDGSYYMAIAGNWYMVNINCNAPNSSSHAKMTVAWNRGPVKYTTQITY